MSGFSPEWLALREPVDVIARNPDVLAACHRYFAKRKSLRICDTGAGTGASVRAFAHLLPDHQYWTLIDHDANSLAAARDALRTWADSCNTTDHILTLRRGHQHIEVRTRVHDFGAGVTDCWSADTDLVTASALLDLTSEPWITDLTVGLSALNTAVLATLTFDGEISAVPAHPLDDEVAAAFRQHQTRDKGFGPAAGAASTGLFKTQLGRARYHVLSGKSPWHLEPSASELFSRTLEGITGAVRETELVPDIDDWYRTQLSNTQRLTIGHEDVFAHPMSHDR